MRGIEDAGGGKVSLFSLVARCDRLFDCRLAVGYCGCRRV